jgi:predicted nucleic acid-binding protein
VLSLPRRAGDQLAGAEVLNVAARRWSARGLTAYDAAYVAAAEDSGVDLITGHAEIIEVAPGLAAALAGQ